MKTGERRRWILERLKTEHSPLSASVLAKEAGVSRQVIVGDIALLRAEEHRIFATPRGYLLEQGHRNGSLFTIVCRHTSEQMEEELRTVVQLGGKVLDVKVEHPLYGEITGSLQVETQEDVDDFIRRVRLHRAEPLCNLTDGVHLHTVSCPGREIYEQICRELEQKGILFAK